MPMANKSSKAGFHDPTGRYGEAMEIGRGSYGEVFRVFDSQLRRFVAVKRMDLHTKEMDGVSATTLREITLLRKLSACPNIVRLLNVFTSGTHITLVFEFVEHDLKKVMEKHISERKVIPRHCVKSIMRQLLSGVQQLHSRRIIHRDLKPQNILHAADGTVKICDFGLSRSVHLPVRTYTHEVVTLWYRPPEILLGIQIYTMAVDMWSVGCIFGELLRGTPLFQGDSEIGQLFAIFKELGTPSVESWPGVKDLKHWQSQLPKFPQRSLQEAFPDISASAEAFDLLAALLQFPPRSRITAQRALQHPYFSTEDAAE